MITKILNFKIRLLKRIIKILAIVIFLAFIALGAFLFFSDFGKWSSLIAEQSQKIIGRPLIVSGKIRPTIDPRKPGFVFHDVTLKAVKKDQAEIKAKTIVVGTKDILKLAKSKKLSEDIALNIEIVGLKVGKQSFDFTKFTFKFKDGDVILNPLSVRAFNTNFYGELRYTKKQRMFLSGKISNFNWGEFLNGANGSFDANLKLKSKGKTTDDILNNLNGTILVKSDAGKIAGRIIDLWGGDLLTNIFANKNKQTNVICSVGLFDIKSGVADTKIIVDTDNVLIKGKGKIYIPKSKLDLKFTPKPKNHSLLSMATPISVTGNWASPTIAPTAGGLLKKIGGILLGTANPAALALSFLKLGSKDNNACVNMLIGKNK